jgi:hypothetical protein
LRRRAIWVQRCACLVVVLTCLLGVLGGFFAVRAVQHASGEDDLRITAITTAPARLDPVDQTAVGNWVAKVRWTDAARVVHRGQVSVPGAVSTGTPVPARLTADGVVRSGPVSPVGDLCLEVMICLGIAVVVLALSLVGSEALGRVAERLRHESWQAAWAQWNPVAPNREEL